MRDDPSFSDTPVTGLYLAAPLLVHVDAHSQYAHFSCQPHCADNRTRFPNELLSLEQNKDAPFLTKEIMVWSYSENSCRSDPHEVTTDHPFFFCLFDRGHWSIIPHGSRNFTRFGKLACQPSSYILPNLWPRSDPRPCLPL